MSSILSIKDLTFNLDNKTFFKDLNLEIKEKKFTSIIGSNKSGKTMLTKIISAIIPTFDKCILDGISLNKENVLKYITKLGIISNDFNNQFLFKKVKDELYYPLINLGYKDHKIEKRINELTDFFEINYILNKDIDDLNNIEKLKLLLVLALLHNPKIIVLDDVFYNLDINNQEFIINKLLELKKKGLTILNITSKLDTIYESDNIYILKDYKIEEINNKEELFNYNTLSKLGLEIPFIIDLSLKLKEDNIIDKIYYKLDELENTLWKSN